MRSARPLGWLPLLGLMLGLLLAAGSVPVVADHDEGLVFPSSLIAFSSANRAGSTVAQVWTIDPNDPTQLTQLTNQGENTRTPRWSRDGKRIAFTQGRRGNERLFVINADGSGVRQVSRSHTRIQAQFWSLDGERIYIYIIVRLGGPCGFAWIRADGAPGQLEHPIIGAEQKCQADVSPDWSTVVFRGYGRRVPIEVGDLLPDGETVTNIRTIVPASFAGAVELFVPVWSPDGTRIAFTADQGGFTGTIYTVAPDGTDPVQITNFTFGFPSSERWSPDGTWLTFHVTHRTARTVDIYIAPSDGSFSPLINLTNSPQYSDFSPDWSPVLSSVFLLIDEDSIDSGAEAIKEIAEDLNIDSSEMVNDDIADPGVRDPLLIPAGTFIGSHDEGGTTAPLMTGEVGDEGWFALKTIPASWGEAGPTDDGLRNYILAGPGLGTGEDPESLLDKIPDVTPLRSAGLEMLVGQRVCALVYDSDISINYDPLEGNLQGANLGLVAFEVLAVGTPQDSVLPDVTIEIVDAEETCGGPLELLLEAPTPISSSEPSP